MKLVLKSRIVITILEGDCRYKEFKGIDMEGYGRIRVILIDIFYIILGFIISLKIC